MKDNIFLHSVIDAVPRLLGQLNRNPSSVSYGSFDRAYWHYRTNDISSARYQEAVLTLAILYKSPFEGNVYYQDAKILEWINASLDFACFIQNRDGSFDEWYPYEGSFVATSFVVAALSKTLLVLGKNNITSHEAILASLVLGADWIARHEEKLVFNQVTGSAVALLNVFLLTHNTFYKQSAERKINFILEHQTPEGWWNEYGGPDIGYLSLMIDYLVTYYEATNDEKVLSALKKANFFITHFLHPNFTSGGEYMSRNTEYLIPSGFARLSADESARIIVAFSATSLMLKQGVHPHNLDDRYLCYILYNWLEAGLVFHSENYVQDSKTYLREREFDVFFQEAGIRVIQNKKYYFVTNLRKGGVFRVYYKDGSYLDSGIEVRYHRSTYISNALDYGNEIKQNPGFLQVRGSLKPIKEPLMKTPIMIAFKMLQITLGRVGILQGAIKKFLRKKMIIYKSEAPVTFERSFAIAENRIEIKDVINKEISPEYFHSGVKSSYIFIPSSKYFTSQELKRNYRGPSEKNYFIKDGKSIMNRIFVIN